MARKLAGFMIDCQSGELDAASRFWSSALGLPVIDPDEGGLGRYALLGTAAGGWHVEVQLVDHEPRLHLDIEADDIDAEADSLEALGAARVAKPHGRWWVMQAPSGQRFCIVRAREPEATAPPAHARDARHHSVLIALVLDCQVDDLGEAMKFWSAALDRPIVNADQDNDGRYGELLSDRGEPFVLLQKVGHASRAHLDIETDDLEAEVARLEKLGAVRVDFVKRWWVMQAPTGHRFCVVGQQAEKKEIKRNAWG